MRAPSDPQAQSALTTWKDIAQFFGRDVRTVQRWEKEEGLPVHRHIHQRKSSVYAYPEELQQWWRERGAGLSAVPAASPAPVPRRWILWGGMALATAVVVLLVGLGTRRFLQANESPVFRLVALEGTRAQGNLSTPITGDVNGDGFEDVILSAGHAREIYVLFGGKTLSNGAELPAAANVVITGANSGWLGVQQVGDYNADGLKDLLVSHLLAEPEAFRATGKSFILWGRKQWPASLVLPDGADVVLLLDWPTDARMSGALMRGQKPDLNGDAIEDVFLDAPEFGFGNDRSTGAVFVLFGREKWPRELEVASAADVLFRGARTGAGFAGPCALGDFNGDGRADLAAFSREHALWNLLGGRGAMALFAGGLQWPRLLNAGPDARVLLEGKRTTAHAVWPLLTDLNGDGMDELITGWPIYHDDPAYPGELRIWYGRADRRGTAPAEAADITIAGSRPGAQFGHAVAVGDADHDGLPDLMVAEPGSGQIYLLYGRTDWKKGGRVGDYAPAVLFRGDVGAGAWQMAWDDFDGDHLPELIFTAQEARGKAEQSGRAWILKPFVPVVVDVRPEHDLNVVLWPGVVVARVLGSSEYSQDRINPATMRLAGAPATRHLEQDFNGDGIPDWQVYFDSAAMKISSGTKQVQFTARTRNGLPVAGTDAVVVLPQMSKDRSSAAR